MQDIFLLAPSHTLFITLLAGLVGIVIGSFLNVVIYRIPHMMQRESDNYVAQENGQPLPYDTPYNLIIPRSACPHCQHRITAFENIPIFSYLLLRGKCSQCKTAISVRYPIVELLSGALSAFLIWHFGANFMGLAACVYTYLLIALTFIDADTQLLPDDLTYPLLWVGLLVNLNGTFVPLSEAVVGAMAGYLGLWSIYWLFKLTTGKEGMGYGDFKLLAALGAWLGWTMLPTIVLLSSLVGAVVGISLIIFTTRQRDQPMPFGPYLAGAGMIALLYGKSIEQWIFGLAI